MRIFGHGFDVVDQGRIGQLLAASPARFDGWLTETETAEAVASQDKAQVLRRTHCCEGGSGKGARNWHR